MVLRAIALFNRLSHNQHGREPSEPPLGRWALAATSLVWHFGVPHHSRPVRISVLIGESESGTFFFFVQVAGFHPGGPGESHPAAPPFGVCRAPARPGRDLRSLLPSTARSGGWAAAPQPEAGRPLSRSRRRRAPGGPAAARATGRCGGPFWPGNRRAHWQWGIMMMLAAGPHSEKRAQTRRQQPASEAQQPSGDCKGAIKMPEGGSLDRKFGSGSHSASGCLRQPQISSSESRKSITG